MQCVGYVRFVGAKKTLSASCPPNVITFASCCWTQSELDSVGVFPDDYMAESFPLDFKLIDDLQQREIPTKVVAM